MKRNDLYITNKTPKLFFLYAVLILPMVFSIYQSTKFLSAATSTGGKVNISFNQPVYKVGDIPNYTITNSLDQAISIINHCPGEPLSVFKYDNQHWVQVHSVANKSICEGEPRTFVIPPGHSVSSTYKYWPDLFNGPGLYLIQGEIEHYTDGPEQVIKITN